MKTILYLMKFELFLLLKHNLTRSAVINLLSSFIVLLFIRIIFDVVYGALPWAIIFISALHIFYVPLLFSWEKEKYSDMLQKYSASQKIFAKWLFVISYSIISLLITYLLFFNKKEIVSGILANALFVTGILSSVGIVYTYKHVININIDSKKGYRKFLNAPRFIICFSPIIMIFAWGIIGQLANVALCVYYKLISVAGIAGFVSMGIWISSSYVKKSR